MITTIDPSSLNFDTPLIKIAEQYIIHRLSFPTSILLKQRETTEMAHTRPTPIQFYVCEFMFAYANLLNFILA